MLSILDNVVNYWNSYYHMVHSVHNKNNKQIRSLKNSRQELWNVLQVHLAFQLEIIIICITMTIKHVFRLWVEVSNDIPGRLATIMRKWEERVKAATGWRNNVQLQREKENLQCRHFLKLHAYLRRSYDLNSFIIISVSYSLI